MILARLSIVARLYLLLGLATLALFLMIGASVIGSGRMAEAGRLLHDQGVLGVEEASHLALLFERQRGFVNRAPAESELDRQRQYRAGFVGLNAELDATLARLAPLVAAAAQEKVPQLAAQFQTLRNQAVAVFDFAENFVQDKAIEALNGPFSETNKQIETTLAALLSSVRNTADGQGIELSDARNFQIAATAAVSLIGILIVDGFGIFLARGLARRLRRITGEMAALARGDMKAEVTAAHDRDEIGEMARALQIFKDNMIETERFRGEQAASEQRQAQQRKADMNKLADDFEGAVGEIIETVSSASAELEASAGTLTSTAERAQELTTNVQSVASATEELTSSVNEISRQVQESARMANEAVDQARTTNDRVGELSKAAARIGDVVELINTIAGQTNLLALNATIEAARAGEAGRGFAVVASEVKALAEQTAKATGEIGQQITGIQAATQDSVNAIREISGTIEKLSEISSTIAAAVEEQGAATQEISRNVQQAAQGTQQVSSNITDVQRGASETGSASSQVLSAAQSLSGDSDRLKLEEGKFLNTVRAA